MRKFIALAALLFCVGAAAGCSALACKDYFRSANHPYSDLTTREQARYVIGLPQKTAYIEAEIPHSQKVYNGTYSVTVITNSRYSDYGYFTRKHGNARIDGNKSRYFEGYIGPRRLDMRDRYVPRRRYHDYDRD